MTASTKTTIRVRPDAPEIIEGIKRGMADAAAGRVVSHDEAMAEIYAVIDAAETKRADKNVRRPAHLIPQRWMSRNGPRSCAHQPIGS